MVRVIIIIFVFVFQVRRAPQRRGAPRPNQSKPHVIRPVEDITEDEIQLVADNMTEKVYNRVTVSFSRTLPAVLFQWDMWEWYNIFIYFANNRLVCSRSS